MSALEQTYIKRLRNIFKTSMVGDELESNFKTFFQALVGITPHTDPTVPAYLVYTALLSQLSTGNPVATVLENTLGFVPVWARSSTGYYWHYNDIYYTSGKVTLYVQYHDAVQNRFYKSYIDWDEDGAMFIRSYNGPDLATPADGMTKVAVEIRIYP